jgi:hypothetical protein
MIGLRPDDVEDARDHGVGLCQRGRRLASLRCRKVVKRDDVLGLGRLVINLIYPDGTRIETPDNAPLARSVTAGVVQRQALAGDRHALHLGRAGRQRSDSTSLNELSTFHGASQKKKHIGPNWECGAPELDPPISVMVRCWNPNRAPD